MNEISEMQIPKTHFVRSPAYLQFVRSLPCVICKTTYGIEAAHVRFFSECGKSLKPGDNFTVPLCGFNSNTGEIGGHHREQTNWAAGEECWWEVRGSKLPHPKVITETLWGIYNKRTFDKPQKWDTADKYIRGLGIG